MAQTMCSMRKCLSLLGLCLVVSAATYAQLGNEKKVNTGTISYYKDGEGNQFYTYSARPYANKKKTNISVVYEDTKMGEDPAAAYKGENSMINDGVKKNERRNINYHNNGVVLPAIDGGR